jgi:hypothetical protein
MLRRSMMKSTARVVITLKSSFGSTPARVSPRRRFVVSGNEFLLA